MGLFDNFKKVDVRSLENPNIPVSSDNFLHLMGWGDFNSSSGVVVNVENALGVPAIWAAVNFISGTLASLPLEVIRRTQSGTDRVTDDVREAQLGSIQKVVLMLIRESPRCMQKHIVDTTGKDQGQISKAIDKPVEVGLVDKTEERLVAQ